MLRMTVGEIAGLVGGTCHRMLDPEQVVTGSVVIDSRQASPGGLFVALKGEHLDGHDFSVQATRQGVVAVLASRPVEAPAVIVPDVAAALNVLAHHAVRRLEATRIGITGSSGKTSAKDLAAQVLASVAETTATVGNQNNELGVPLTVLSATEATRYLVLEMGARGIGHLDQLTRLAPIEAAIVLNVGTAHLGEFGSADNIALAKGELVQALPTDGIAVLNADDSRVAEMASRTNAQVTFFGRSENAHVRADGVILDRLGRPAFTLVAPDGAARVQLQLLGEHHVSNALAVAALAHRLGMAVEWIATELSRARALTGGRMELHERADGVTVIDDAYNANPDSMRAALTALSLMEAQRRIAVLGAMAELGHENERAHREIGALAARLGVDLVVGVGGLEADLITGSASSLGARVLRIGEPGAVSESLAGVLERGDVVLVKSSRAAGLRAAALALIKQD